MSRAQRILVVIYLLAVTYCCAWIPWRVTSIYIPDNRYWRVAYGWVWSGPNWTAPNGVQLNATPDTAMIGLRFVAVTAFCGAVYLALAFIKPAILRRRWPKLSKDEWSNVLREFKRLQDDPDTKADTSVR
ncbi:MAG: hypothetical protein ACLP00_08805 [Terracidiphilus sp.]